MLCIYFAFYLFLNGVKVYNWDILLLMYSELTHAKI